jgi:hypothetical protein
MAPLWLPKSGVGALGQPRSRLKMGSFGPSVLVLYKPDRYQLVWDQVLLFLTYAYLLSSQLQPS